jgi:hypothetical protein
MAEACRAARARFNSIGSILSRGLDLRAHLRDPFRAMVYFAGNLISRQDIARKQGLSLGLADTDKQTEPIPL